MIHRNLSGSGRVLNNAMVPMYTAILYRAKQECTEGLMYTNFSRSTRRKFLATAEARNDDSFHKPALREYIERDHRNRSHSRSSH